MVFGYEAPVSRVGREYMNFGYPRTWQGVLVALAMYGLIFAIAIGYICFYPYA